MNKSYDELLKEYDASQYCRVIVKDRCGIGFNLRIESYNDICKILATHHSPEVTITLSKFNITGSARLLTKYGDFDFLKSLRKYHTTNVYGTATIEGGGEETIASTIPCLSTKTLVNRITINNAIRNLRRNDPSGDKLERISIEKTRTGGIFKDFHFMIQIGETRFTFTVTIDSEKKLAPAAVSKILNIVIKDSGIELFEENLDEILEACNKMETHMGV